MQMRNAMLAVLSLNWFSSFWAPLLSRAPELAPLKSKMIYASSKDAIKKKFQGIEHKCQANRPEDLNRACIAEKLGGSLIVAFEGCPV